MQPIFTMQYGEFAVADYIKQHLKGVSVFVPSSSQEKGIDLVLYRFINGTNNVQTIQVKMSRVYFNNNENDVVGSFWFDKFKIPENADWIILDGIVPVKIGEKIEDIRNIKWEHKLICLSNGEAKQFMSRLKKKSGEPETKFGFSYDINDCFYLSRGGDWESLDFYKLKRRLKDIDKKLSSDESSC